VVFTRCNIPEAMRAWGRFFPGADVEQLHPDHAELVAHAVPDRSRTARGWMKYETGGICNFHAIDIWPPSPWRRCISTPFQKVLYNGADSQIRAS